MDRPIIQIIDRNASLRADIADLLALNDYEVWQAANEAEALAMLDAKPRLPNVILLQADDIGRSTQFVAAVRARSDVVRMVYLVDVDYWMLRWHEPVDDTLYKPFAPDDLTSIVRTQLSRQQVGRKRFPVIEPNGPRLLVILSSERIRDHLHVRLYHALAVDESVLSPGDADLYHKMARWIEMEVITSDAATLARIAQARAIQPSLPIILMTDQADFAAYAAINNLTVLRPPVSAGEFIATIRRLGGTW